MNAPASALIVLLALGCASAPRSSPADSDAPVYDGKPIEFWLEEVKDLSWDRRKAAMKALDAFGEEAAPRLAAMLGDSRPRIRQVAARALGEMYHKAAPAADALCAAARDSDEGVRAEALGALRNLALIAGGPDEALSTLGEAATTDPSLDLRKYAVKSLEEIKEAAAKRVKNSP